MTKTVAISGYFDPIHGGHIDYIEAAAQFGRLVVFLNTDEAAIRKKGYAFMPFKDKARILMAMKGVDVVMPAMDSDGSVCKNLELIRPDIFANGGDRFEDNIPEKSTCERLGIEMVFNVGGGKVQSSSALVENVISDTLLNHAGNAR